MEKRGKERIATDDAILFSIDDVVMRGTMRNITQDGCMIDGCSVEAESGQKVEVTLIEGIVAHGEIVWAKGERIGVTFYHPVDEVAVKYFQLDDLVEGDCKPPTDRFGRDMQPMRRNHGLG